jgi:type VI secretion system protein ImpJ
MWNKKVIWSEGMFLRPQHFQQQERHFSNLVELRVASLRPYPWGFSELKLDEQLLSVGKIAVTSARGVFPDGLPFSIPGDDEPPAPLDVPDGTKSQDVVLALPLRRPALEEVDPEDERRALRVLPSRITRHATPMPTPRRRRCFKSESCGCG